MGVLYFLMFNLFFGLDIIIPNSYNLDYVLNFYLLNNLTLVIVFYPWRGGRVVEGSGLENRRSLCGLPWVRIPPPPFV